MEEPSKCDILFTKRDLQTLCLAGVRKISKLYEKSAIKKNTVRIVFELDKGLILKIEAFCSHQNVFFFLFFGTLIRQ